ncbi:flagellar biosynthesis protein FlhB [Sideroxydans lithotrophicus]|uniref:Flagellar biosynthetic protein FlhB n=1 Tax=Sideroxydans lithotrophicus (strain ES-1) TaxID=580332 RepID=D5CMV9_SIDLE|nr:flagellar biosynthesis protein FlhB [Sideroxydans lithotrophicus]ADE10795.1 flagellar biosynthetic protein FlhB [Sideroxydans lithotrophicus ES-1]
MAEQDSDLEKTESPSQRRLDQAREEGQVARSRELSTFAVLMAGGAGIWLMGGMLSQQLISLIREGLTLDTGLAFHSELLVPRLHDLSMSTLLVFLPLLGLLLAVAAFSPLLLNGWLFTLKPLQPNFGKLNPITGIGRMFSTNSLMELAKAIAKAVVVGGIGALVIWHNKNAVLLLVSEPIASAIPHLGSLVWGSFAAVMGGLLLIVAVDVPFQLWEHNKKLKMTKEEVRQESKETEGDPQVKARVRSMQREMARRRMMAEIPKADVVVTNPTHYSVALKYSDSKMRAPVVVAKGSHLMAAKIKEIAKEHNVPILEAPPLARALHKHCELGEAIPEALYTAVAEVLAYVYQLRRYKQVGGTYPQEPHELPVPEELDPANAAL